MWSFTKKVKTSVPESLKVPEPVTFYKIIDEEVELSKFEKHISILMKNGKLYQYVLTMNNYCYANAVNLITGKNAYYYDNGTTVDTTRVHQNISDSSYYIGGQPPCRTIYGKISSDTIFKIEQKTYTVKYEDIDIITEEVIEVGTHKLTNKIMVKI